MRQLTMDFMADTPLANEPGQFSHNRVCAEQARADLEVQYGSIVEVTDRFNRQTVSFQANKVATLHSWFKYREGFSGQLVESLLDEFGINPGGSVLDPFAGSCTTLLQAKMRGVNAVGIELLPYCHWMWEAKSRAFDYDLRELLRVRTLLIREIPPPSGLPFPHLTITESAFPDKVEQDLMDYSSWLAALGFDANVKLLCQALLLSILEDVSYTRKDGQYLRWDSRASKLRQRNELRKAQGESPLGGIDKGRIPSVKEVLLHKLDAVIADIQRLQADPPHRGSNHSLIKGNTLFELPRIPSSTFNAVITSPPYANRYDYTRTYALELAFLDVQDDIFGLRQSMLSCTVENRDKMGPLATLYEALGEKDRFEHVNWTVRNSAVLKEVDSALEIRRRRGEINNAGVPRMIHQYFVELAFVFAELYRVCKRGAYVAFVNDNVRYAGEVIPVDLISTSLAEGLGFQPVKVYVIPQRKGNSSQQMKRFGRRDLRKSITVWHKP